MWRISAVLVTLSLSSVGTTLSTRAASCKVVPTDETWPDTSLWESFNRSVGGNLLRGIPVGSVCHDPTFDEAECQNVRDRWTNARLYLDEPASMQSSVFYDKACDPFTDRSTPCVNGAYPEYVVNVTSPADVIKTIDFVKEHNIRLVVKNTGHDYMGRSTGHAAVSVWTHYHQGREWYDSYKDPWSNYTGPAVKAFAGVMGEQLSQDAHAHGYSIVVGECPTVGYVGGYIQGGGHSVLSGHRGMAADHVLSFEVITTEGLFLNASTTENPDLFWALRGGGGGTYGIVWSATIAVFPDEPMSLATISFNVEENGDTLYWSAFETFQRHTQAFADTGAWVFSDYSNLTFIVPAFILPNKTLEDLSSLTAPLFDDFDALGLQYNKTLDEFPSYLDTIDALPAFSSDLVNNAQWGSRLLPPSVFSNETLFAQYLSIAKQFASQGYDVREVVMQPSLSVGGNPDNAVFPEWRNTQRLFLELKPYGNTDTLEKIKSDQVEITTQAEPFLKALSAGTYLNEADPFNADWKHDFYGVNYDRLLSIKDKYDPSQLLYGSISVGGDRWAEEDGGRLCPTSGQV